MNYQIRVIKELNGDIRNIAIGSISKQSIDECKPEILKYLLNSIKNDDRFQFRSIMAKLTYFEIEWPEVDIINKSLTADKLLK